MIELQNDYEKVYYVSSDSKYPVDEDIILLVSHIASAGYSLNDKKRRNSPFPCKYII